MLSKNEALLIIDSGQMNYWTCQDCITTLFPATCEGILTTDDNTTSETVSKIQQTRHSPTVECPACNNRCSSHVTNNCAICPWCDRLCHKKCLRNSLGCLGCCNNMIPGYNHKSYELTNGTPIHPIAFNPYDHNSLANQIGDRSEITDERPIWDEISEQLTNCNYSTVRDVKMSRANELKILSLNIRSLTKNIDLFRENIGHFNKFDIICLCETNCNIESLPHGVDDLIIEGFHTPITLNPLRKSNKGGGLAIYVNRRICEETDFELMHLNLDNDNASTNTIPSCEAMFSKLNIKLANNIRRTYIIGNIYRSPSSKPNDFLQTLECILSKLESHRNKQIILVGDLNIDLVKYDYDSNCQQLIDLTTRHGFIQTITKPTRVTDHSATLIDHIYTNQIHNICSHRV